MTNISLFVQLFMGFLLSTALADSNCGIKLNPPKVVVKYGDSVSINCTVENEQIEGMGWEATVNGTGLTKVNHLMWSVENITDWNKESFCYVNWPSGDQCIQTSIIVLYTVPKVKIVSSSHDWNMVEGQMYNLTCEVDVTAPPENLSLLWYKDDRLLTDMDKIKTFTPKKEDQGATFKCEARLDLRPEGPYMNVSSEIMTVNVLFGPEIFCVNEEIPEGETLESKCPVHGNPTPSAVQWFKNGSKINSSQPLSRNDAGIYTVNAEGNSFLKKNVSVSILYGPEVMNCPNNYTVPEHSTIDLSCITGNPKPNVTLQKEGEMVDLGIITRDDAGSYTLVASIGNRHVTHKFEVIVYYGPSQIEELEDLNFPLGSSVYLECSAKGNPRPEYEWDYKNTSNVSEKKDDGVSRLEIHNATPFNIGNYTCRASNKYGTVSKTARLTMKDSNCGIKLNPPKVVVKYGDSVSINCTVEKEHDGMGWEATVNGTGITKVNHLMWSVENITDWNKESFCYVNWPSGDQCIQTSIIVLYTVPKVKIVSSSHDWNMVEGQMYNLTCEVDVTAPPENLSLLWYKDDRLLTDMDKIKTFTPKKEDQGAMFKCEARLDLRPEGPYMNVSSEIRTVNVLYGPSQIEELEDLNFTLGSSVYLKCSAKGNPRPEYEWDYKNTSNVSEKKDDEASRLEIHNATPFNIGNYMCRASNKYGTVSKTARLTMKGAKQECSLQITPADRMVLEYKNGSMNVTCKSTCSYAKVHWQNNNDSSVWTVAMDNWDVRPGKCEGDDGFETRTKELDIILYKKPDSVSISFVNIKGGNVILEDNYVTLVCEITSVAPAKYVFVRWFHGNESFTPEHVHNCYGYNIEETRSNVNISFRTNITANKAFNGMNFSCQAVFNLTEIENITLPPSKPQNLTVNYKPRINTTKLSSPVPVFSGYAEELKCEADGNPSPEIIWSSNNVTLPPQQPANILTVTEKGTYRCTAKNEYGSDYRDVEVIVKVDYLPLIAGFVAVTVVIISVIFVFIYSIYYKNTKMRRYNLKNPKLGVPNNDNVAHNGWDLPLPMTKLS